MRATTARPAALTPIQKPLVRLPAATKCSGRCMRVSTSAHSPSASPANWNNRQAISTAYWV